MESLYGLLTSLLKVAAVDLLFLLHVQSFSLESHLGRRAVHQSLVKLLQRVDGKLVARLQLELPDHVLLLLLVERCECLLLTHARPRRRCPV